MAQIKQEQLKLVTQYYKVYQMEDHYVTSTILKDGRELIISSMGQYPENIEDVERVIFKKVKEDEIVKNATNKV